LVEKIPNGWVPTPIKVVGDLRGGAGFPHDEQGKEDQKIEFHKVNALGSADAHDFLSQSENTISESTAARLRAFVFPPKSIVFAKVGAALLLSRFRWLKRPACLDNNMMGLVTRAGFEPKYVKYALSVLPMSYVVNPGAVPSINETKVGNLFLAFPSSIEQTQIAKFLDYETGKMGALIEKQQQLIRLLKEKRQAVISHAVTKGLNPDAPMRDSGIAWLGEVPAHWNLTPVKHLCSFAGGSTPSKENLHYWELGTIPWVSPKDMKVFWLSDTQDKITEAAVNESPVSRIAPGALLMVVRSGILQRTIPVAINTMAVTLNQDMKALTFSEPKNAEYFAYLVQGHVFELIRRWTKEGATVESVEHEYLANDSMPNVPCEERKAIVAFLDDETTKIDELIKKAVLMITLLQERRTALISAAVTGKIDLRGWRTPEPKTEPT